jgi:methyl-accepting chemotaxis protein
LLGRGQGNEFAADTLARSSLFNEVLDTLQPNGGITLSPSNGQICLEAFTPLTFNGSMAGVIRTGSSLKEILPNYARTLHAEIILITARQNTPSESDRNTSTSQRDMRVQGKTILSSSAEEGVTQAVVSAYTRGDKQISLEDHRYRIRTTPLTFQGRPVDDVQVIMIANLRTYQGSLLTQLGVGLGIGLIAIFLINFVLYRIMHKKIWLPLDRSAAHLREMAQGNFSIPVSKHAISRQDEFGDFAQSLHSLNLGMQRIIGDILTSANELNERATTLNKMAAEMSNSTDLAVQRTESISSASEEMAATSFEIARNCTTAATHSTDANALASQGDDIVNNTVKGMNLVSNQVHESESAIEKLGRRSNEIGEIIKTIQEIADQTNLLALNAAIEAARAGEQGRGFAVVADEIRVLAGRSSEAAKEIASMIGEIQSETEIAVDSMNACVESVTQGTRDAMRSGEAIHTIQAKIDELTGQIHQIATAAEEQSVTSEEMTRHLSEVAQAVTQTVTVSRETFSASSSVKQQSENLRKTVSGLKIK